MNYLNLAGVKKEQTYVVLGRRFWQNSSPLFSAARRQTARRATCPSLRMTAALLELQAGGGSRCWVSCCPPGHWAGYAAEGFHPWRCTVQIISGSSQSAAAAQARRRSRSPGQGPSGVCRCCGVYGHQIRVTSSRHDAVWREQDVDGLGDKLQRQRRGMIGWGRKHGTRDARGERMAAGR